MEKSKIINPHSCAIGLTGKISMPKQVKYIEVTKDGVTTKHKNNITALCKVLKVPYGTIIKKKMPFEFRGYGFERIIIK